MSKLADLCRPFPNHLVKSNPSGGGSYVPHPFYTQRLLLVLGGYSFEKIEIIRGDVPGRPPNPNAESERGRQGTPDLHNVIVGVMMRLTITVDDVTHVYENVGDCEQPHNWDTDGKRLKDAVSDAKKRCCADAGLGLFLYMKDQKDFVLLEQLRRRDGEAERAADTHPPRPVEDTADVAEFDPDDPGRPM